MSMQRSISRPPARTVSGEPVFVSAVIDSASNAEPHLTTNQIGQALEINMVRAATVGIHLTCFYDSRGDRGAYDRDLSAGSLAPWVPHLIFARLIVAASLAAQSIRPQWLERKLHE